jgi:DNA-binding XRE family transcriptional regulator
MTGDDLKELRRKLGFTQAQMAEAIGLSLRPYIEVEHHGEEAIRKTHKLAAERISLREAVRQDDLNLALASARRDAVYYADMLRRG